MNDDTLSLLTLLSGPLMVGAVTGAWLAAGRLFVIRLGGVRLPAWMPWIIAPLGALGGLVIVSSQLIGAMASLAATPGAERTSAAVIALLLSPAWLGGAALAALGVALHYVLDGLLKRLPLGAIVFEGLAEGLRAAWATIGLLTLFFGLQTTYQAASGQFGLTIADVAAGGGAYRLLINTLALAVAVSGMITPHLMERSTARAAASSAG